MQQRTSEEINTLLFSYNLCESALSCHNVLKEHICQSLFHAGIVSYYSICKSVREKQWILKLLETPEEIKFIHLRRSLSLRPGQLLHERIKEIFEKYEKIRDKNIAHKDKKSIQKEGVAWLKIPQGIGGGEVLNNGILFSGERAFITFSLIEQNEFLTLIELTLDLWWRKENLPIYKEGSDGKIYTIPQPNPIR